MRRPLSSWLGCSLRSARLSIIAAMVIGSAGCGAAAPTATVASTSTSGQITSARSTAGTSPVSSTTSTATNRTAPFSGVATNANYGPATDQSGCPGMQLTVGPDTSCAFAGKVAAVVDAAHHATGHFPASLTAFSPATRKTYRLRCSILGYGSELVCSTLPPATGIVVIPIRAPATATATTPPPPNSTPESTVEGPGSSSHATDAQFCSTHECIENFGSGHGYIVQCADGQWSHSGGLSGACSDHGGER